MEQKKISFEALLFWTAMVPGALLFLYDYRYSMYLILGATALMLLVALLGWVAGKQINAVTDVLPAEERTIRGLLDPANLNGTLMIRRKVIAFSLGAMMVVCGMAAGMMVMLSFNLDKFK